jgi:hypothetical protein
MRGCRRSNKRHRITLKRQPRAETRFTPSRSRPRRSCHGDFPRSSDSNNPVQFLSIFDQTARPKIPPPPGLGLYSQAAAASSRTTNGRGVRPANVPFGASPCISAQAAARGTRRENSGGEIASRRHKCLATPFIEFGHLFLCSSVTTVGYESFSMNPRAGVRSRTV